MRTYAWYEFKLVGKEEEFVKKYEGRSAKEVKEFYKQLTGRSTFDHSFSHWKDFRVVSPEYDYIYLFTIDDED